MMNQLTTLSDALSRSIRPENFPSEKSSGGLAQVLRPDSIYQSQIRFGMYRWHITDPDRFSKNFHVTIQALGWRSGRRYLPVQDDIAAVAYWYQFLPTAPFPKLPERDYLEIT
jgi:hypothetical protein